MSDGLLIVFVVLAISAILWYMVYLTYIHRVEDECEIKDSLSYGFEEEETFEYETDGKSTSGI